MNIKIEEIKEFVKKHKKGILFTGGVILGATVAIVICKSTLKGEVKIIERLPEWAEKWRAHCMSNNLLYENGLPIFANLEHTAIYRDAIVESAIPDFIEMGFEIIDRA